MYRTRAWLGNKVNSAKGRGRKCTLAGKELKRSTDLGCWKKKLAVVWSIRLAAYKCHHHRPPPPPFRGTAAKAKFSNFDQWCLDYWSLGIGLMERVWNSVSTMSMAMHNYLRIHCLWAELSGVGSNHWSPNAVTISQSKSLPEMSLAQLASNR